MTSDQAKVVCMTEWQQKQLRETFHQHRCPPEASQHLQVRLPLCKASSSQQWMKLFFQCRKSAGASEAEQT